MKKIIMMLCAALAGCAAEPVPYHSQNEIPQGPGLLTGAEGAFVLRSATIPPQETARGGDVGNAKGPGSMAR